MHFGPLALVCATLTAAAPAQSAGFEAPPDESPESILPADQIAGEDFHVVAPVRSDGLMRHYVVESRFGVFEAYGHQSLEVRLREVAALTKISKTTDLDVVAKAVVRRTEADAKTVLAFAMKPVETVAAIPKGVTHLFAGYTAQAKEVSEEVHKDSREFSEAAHKGGTASTSMQVRNKARKDARRYADRYFGVSAAERRWYQQLGVDPYTSTDALRKAVAHLARVDAAASFGLKFAPIPGIPYAGDLHRAMDAIYNEDPAVLRARRRMTLAGYGLEQAEIDGFESALLLNPTRQSQIEQTANSLDGVDGRAELFRHAMALTSDEEIQVFLQSIELLVTIHRAQPLARILPGVRLPAGERTDGRVVVCGSFDAVYWTEEVAGLAQSLRAALPAAAAAYELWLSGSVSELARAELAARGWEVHDAPFLEARD